MSEVHREAAHRSTRTMPAVPGINAGRLGPNVGVGNARTNVKRPVGWGPIRSFRVRPTGGTIDAGRTTVTNAREAAFIRARESGQNALAAQLDPARTAQSEEIAKLLAGYLSGACKTDEIREIVRAWHSATGKVSPI